MPNMDGTGPRYTGSHAGWGNGRHGGAGRGNTGCRCGRGPCAYYDAPDEKTALQSQRDALKRSLDSLEKRLETL